MVTKKSNSVFGNIAQFMRDVIDTSKYDWLIKMVVKILGVCVAAFFIYLGYQWYYTHKQQVAQKALAEAIAEYKTMVQADHQDWDRMQMLFKAGAEQQSGTVAQSYFLAYQADALIHDNKKEEALAVMDRVVSQLSTKSLLYNLFKTKRALMRLDSLDEAIRNAGVEELIELGRNSQNIYKDMALYQLGNYYWSLHKKADALQVWQELVNQYQYDIVSPSPWSQLAQQKIKMVVA